MKQLTTAFIQYTWDNKGIFPGRGGYDPYYHNAADPKRGTWNWIAWHRKIDPVTGKWNLLAHDLNITHSAIAKYLGGKFVDHNPNNVVSQATWAQANFVNKSVDSLFRCPADNLEQRPYFIGDFNRQGEYRYSYGANTYTLSGESSVKRMRDIRRPYERLLLVCEDEKCLDDGNYNPNPHNWIRGESSNVMGSRHQMRVTAVRAGKWKRDGVTVAVQDAMGLASFCDGHVAPMSRRDALRPKYTGAPGPDPLGP